MSDGYVSELDALDFEDDLDDDLEDTSVPKSPTPKEEKPPTEFEAGWQRFLRERGIKSEDDLPMPEFRKLLDEYAAEGRQRADAERAEQVRRAPSETKIGKLKNTIANLDARIAQLSPSNGPQAAADGALWTKLMEERALAGFALEELEVELPFIGVDDTTLEGIRENREIAFEEVQDRLRDAKAKWGQSGAPSARLRKVEREHLAAMESLAEVKRTQEQRRSLADYKRANEALIDRKVAGAIEAHKRQERFKAEQEFEIERRAGRMSEWDVKVEMELVNRRLNNMPPDQLAQLQKKARSEVEAEHAKILRQHIVRGG
jgi:hypothetical protein